MGMGRVFKQIEQLRGWRQAAFILALAERAYPNFALFAELSGQAHHKPVERVLQAVWEALASDEQEPDYRRMIERVEEQMPQPEQFEGYGVRPALDACELLLDALMARLQPNKKLALAAAQRSLATVTDFVEFNDAEGVDEDDLVRHLERHPLVRQEQAFQRELVERLRRAPYPSEEFLAALRDLAQNQGISNIGIALEESAGDEA